jgi:thiol-disulfide isomerase/thioredoxin
VTGSGGLLFLKVTAFILTLLVPALLLGQRDLSEAENKDLQSLLSGTSNSSSEVARALEKHLKKYPDSPQKEDMEQAILKSAMESNDKARILGYGERALARNIEQPLILERVAEILAESEDKTDSERALKYAQKFEEILRALEREGPSTRRNRARLLEELDRALGRALLLQARATGNLGKPDEAVALAKKSWDTYPAAAAAREVARWEERAGRNMAAVRRYADAFTVSDPKNTDAERARDRVKMGQLYRREKDSETGLGDLVLEAYDRTSDAVAKRLEIQRDRDPNAQVKDPMDYTLTALEGTPLTLKSLRGKVVVMDFWATWCGPCRVQHPLYEQVKERFKSRDDVVFLAINTDEDPSLVKPFLEEHKWNPKTVYFEDGLSNLLRVSSIPTTIIVDKQGQIFSRMNGFVPEKFVEHLTATIREAGAADR